ncbi:LuxR C-terminal-related transcriptional regulator [Kitasatospora sp. NPDC057015]|uniref:LuxR C-terminal-related transcriptional regulator n=1 Tax=Kitasatospora sp. NPDC057015 TaxID=3346001 RepID=UPI003636D2EC
MTADPTAAPDAGVPDEAARQLYLAILAEGGAIPVTTVDPSDEAALRQLIDTGLLMPNAVDASYTAVSPRAVSDRIGAELRSEATRLLVRAEGLPTELESLTKAYESVPRLPGQHGDATLVEGREAIRQRIAELLSDCKEGLLTAQPGSRPPMTMALSLRQDVPLLASGRTLRTLYQPMAVLDGTAADYALEVTRLGARLRVLDEPFQRMIIIDRSIAVVPAADDHSRAAFISDPAAVAFLVAVFERDWARADSVEWDAALSKGPARLAADRVGRLLATGLTQRAVATRLGLSERTVAAHIARLRERHGAQTLFQLGWLMRGGRGE